MPRPPLWYLKKVELFADMSDEEMMELIAGITDCEYPNKHLLYTPHEEVDQTYILKEGEVTLYKTIDGRKVILDILKPGSLFGNIGFAAEVSDGHFAEITQQSYVCTLPQNFFLQLLQKKPSIAVTALSILSKRINQYQSQLKFLSMLGARERILATIHLLNEKDSNSILPSVLRIPTKITHDKLASMTGLTRETVTKQLLKLEEEGCLKRKGKQIQLTEHGIRTVEEL